MSSSEDRTGEPQPLQQDYVDIIRSDVTVERQYLEGNGLPAKIVYFCPECKALITPKRIGNKFRFSCAECKCDKVAFGTEKSVANFYRLAGKKGLKKEE